MTRKEFRERLSAIGMPIEYFAAATGQRLNDVDRWRSIPTWVNRVIEGYEMGDVVAKSLAIADEHDWSDASTQAGMSLLDSFLQKIGARSTNE